MKHILTLLLLAGAGLLLPAQPLQLQLQLMPGQALNQASSVYLVHTGTEAIQIYLLLEIQGTQSQALKTPFFTLNPGTHRHSLTELFPALGSQAMADIREGELCLSVYNPEQLLAKVCQAFQGLPAIPPHLVYPFDGEALSIPLPVFSWTPPMPISFGQALHYTLTIVELTDFQPPAAAIQSLPPYYQQHELPQNLHPYEPSAPAFAVGKTYAWQIQAYLGPQFVGQSEVWTFSPAAEEEEVDHTPFVQLRRHYDAGTYEARGKVKFRFDAPYGEPAPQWQVLNARGEPVPLRLGMLKTYARNLYILDLPPGSGLIGGDTYFLEVRNYKGELRKLKFRYYYP